MCEGARVHRVAFWFSALIALICVLVVVVTVVITGRDGTVANWSAVLAGAALVASLPACAAGSAQRLIGRLCLTHSHAAFPEGPHR